MAPAPKFSPEVEEELVLRSAAHVIGNSSILDFKMSAIAAEAGISMGSVYKHVQCKEDVMIALVSKMLETTFFKFEEILKLPLSTPERCVASVMADFSLCGLYSFDEHLKMLVTNEAVLRKGSAKWRDRMLHWERKIEELVHKALETAFETGELKAANRLAVLDQLNLGIWAFCSGFSQISVLKDGFSLYGEIRALEDPYTPDSPQVQCVKAFLSGFDWRTPLDDEGVLRVSSQLEGIGLQKKGAKCS